jgi:hypothetical protein
VREREDTLTCERDVIHPLLVVLSIVTLTSYIFIIIITLRVLSHVP